MGVLNVTPDSFADGGHFLDPARAVDAALAMQDAGADLIDVGGESTRPGAAEVSADEERRRIEPVLERLAGRVTIPISIDTYKSDVARAALERGASLVNDVSALRYDPALADVVAASGAAVILMHNRGRSSDMYRDARYEDAVAEIGRELGERLGAAIAAGISPERVVLDPGVGFAARGPVAQVVPEGGHRRPRGRGPRLGDGRCRHRVGAARRAPRARACRDGDGGRRAHG